MLEITITDFASNKQK